MNDNSLRKTIVENFKLKENDELLQIWQDNKRYEWSDLSFDAIKQILQERGVEIPPQDEPLLEAEIGSDENDDEIPIGQPAFYKPEELIFFANATSIMAWVALGVNLILAVRPFVFGLDDFPSADGPIWIFLSQTVSGVISFALLKGISFALKVLMEFEFNTRNVK